MAARFWFVTDEGLLAPDMIATLATAAIRGGSPDPVSLKKQLVHDTPNSDSMVVPPDQILVLIGTTAELKDFCVRLSDSRQCLIGHDQKHPTNDPFLMWSTRVKVNHPDMFLERKATVTLIVTGFAKKFGPTNAPPPWKAVPPMYRGFDLWRLNADFDAKPDAKG